MTLAIEDLLALYAQHREDLRRVRRELQRLHDRRCVPWRERTVLHRIAARLLRPFFAGASAPAPMLAQTDDEQCELLYLLLRQQQPTTVVEISPFHGWSTSWILSALRDNTRAATGAAGMLHSFDLLDAALHNVPLSLRTLPDGRPRWELRTGDVRRQAIPARIDFLLMDSDHSAEFAAWYVREVFPLVVANGVVCVDDVFHTADPGSFDGEGRYVVDWLSAQGIEFFTCAKARNPSALNAIFGHKVAHGLGARIRRGDANTGIFFRMPADWPRRRGSHPPKRPVP